MSLNGIRVFRVCIWLGNCFIECSSALILDIRLSIHWTNYMFNHPPQGIRSARYSQLFESRAIANLNISNIPVSKG